MFFVLHTVLHAHHALHCFVRTLQLLGPLNNAGDEMCQWEACKALLHFRLPTEERTQQNINYFGGLARWISKALHLSTTRS